MKSRIIASAVTVVALLIAFVSPAAKAGTFINLWLVRADGSEVRQLTNFRDQEVNWSWDVSPDGKHIVVGLPSQLVFYSVDGKKEASVSIEGSMVISTTWHADGIISYASYDKSTKKTAYSTFAWPNGPSARLADLGKEVWVAQISPDRRWIILERYEGDDKYSVFLVDVKSGLWHSLPFERLGNAVWSPSSELVAFSHLDSLYVVDTAGQIVSKATEEAIGPHTWTSDGRALLISSYETYLGLLDPLSGRVLKHAPLSSYVPTAGSSRDGRLAIVLREGVFHSLWLSGWTTLPSRLLDMPEGYPLDIKWLPDGSAMLMEWLTWSANPKPHIYRQTVPPVEPMIGEALSPDFRNISWGMTVEEAVAAEKDAVLHQE